MRVMFHMMNNARLATGFIGYISGSAAYLYALDYARQRQQGRDLENIMDAEAPPVEIIRHPDVRRMLLWMKAHVDGMRSLIYFTASCFDQITCAESDADKDYYQGLLDLLTPVVKAYCSDKGFEICVQAVQVFGGYGYTQDYPVEQLLRDCKITSIYEGTNGIQAMDLLGRKLGLKKGAVFMSLLQEMQKTIEQAKSFAALKDLHPKVGAAVTRLGEIAMHIGQTAMSPDFKTAFAFAQPFQDAMGDIVMAWMHLWRATLAVPKLDDLVGGLTGPAREKKLGKNKEAAFYDGQLKTATYFINTILPVTMGKMEAIAVTDNSAVAIHEASFGS
jgi:hypothetical protein